MVSFYKKYRKPILFFSAALLIVIFDQLTKILVKKFLIQPIKIIPKFLSLTYTQNTGAGFGLLQGFNLLLILISLIIIGFILYYYKKIKTNQKLLLFSTALVLGGAIGNLIDRILYNFVTDFISFAFWPAFNIADISISVGVIGLVVYFWKKK
ncbi:signal peptidase II [Nanoarchaeota archaeon]